MLNWGLRDYRLSGSPLCCAQTRDCWCLQSDTHKYYIVQKLHIYLCAANHIFLLAFHKHSYGWWLEFSVHKQLKPCKWYLHEVWAIYAAIWKVCSRPIPAGITLLWRYTCSPCGCLVSRTGYLSCGFWTGFLVLPLLFLLLFCLLLLELCCLSSDCLVACRKFVGNFNVTPLVEMPPLQNLLSLISKKAGTKLCNS